MSGNPFLVPAPMTTFLDREDCQRLHYQALQAAVRGSRPEALPASVPLNELRECARLDGAEVYLAHPADIERLFAGITLEVYRTVRSLFCSRLGRSIKMVWRMLCAMACAAGVESIPYETIWALCLSLEERRLASIAVPVERGEDTWWIGVTTPDISIQQGTATAYRPSIAWCVEASAPRALSFCIAPLDAADDTAARALYDAIMAHRRPQARVPTGLIWHLPQRIMTTVPLSRPCVAACTRAGIQVEASTAEIPLLEHIRKTWERGVVGRTLLVRHCAGLLDTFLRSTHGYGPQRAYEQQTLFLPLLHHWRELDGPPLPYPGEHMVQAAGCMLSEYRLETAESTVQAQAHPGFLGWVEYTCRAGEITAIASLNALARLAFFTGCGYLTALGMGTTAVTITN